MNEIKTIHSSFNGFTDIKLYAADRPGSTIYCTEKPLLYQRHCTIRSLSPIWFVIPSSIHLNHQILFFRLQEKRKSIEFDKKWRCNQIIVLKLYPSISTRRNCIR